MSSPELDPIGVGPVRLVRAFRVGNDGGLYAVHSPYRWEQGWNVASCRKRRGHAPPAEGCACGFYAYAHPAYARRQPSSGQVLAVVSAHGTMEAGSRGARLGLARIEAVWLGPRVREELAARVRRRYPRVLVYRDRAAMLADLPLTELDGFRRPRLPDGWRWIGYAALALLLVAAGIVGSLSSTALTREGGPVWITVALTAVAVAVVAVFRKAQMVTLAALAAVAWLVTETSTSVVAALYRGVVVAVVAGVLGSWWWTGRVGADPSESGLGLLVRRLRSWLPGDK